MGKKKNNFEAPSGYQRILSATDAKKQRTEDNKRLYGPFCVTLQCRFSKLEIGTETLDFYLYGADPEKAVHVASEILLRKFYPRAESPVPLSEGGKWPKPEGKGRVEPIEDSEYNAALKKARNSTGVLRMIGDPNDPTAFHLKESSNIIV